MDMVNQIHMKENLKMIHMKENLEMVYIMDLEKKVKYININIQNYTMKEIL